MMNLGEEQIGGKVWGEIRRPEYIEYSIENWKNDDRKLMDALEKYKLHGGPITLKNIEKLGKLYDKEIKEQSSYYTKILGSGIRFKNKAENKFIPFSTEELQNQIRDILKWPKDINENSDEMIKCIFSPVQTISMSSISIPAFESTNIVQPTNEIEIIGW